MDDSLIDRLRAELTDDLYLRLLRYARYLASTKFWWLRRGGEDDLACGECCVDLIANVVRQIIENHSWNPEQIPLYPHMKRILFREFCNLARKAKTEDRVALSSETPDDTPLESPVANCHSIQIVDAREKAAMAQVLKKLRDDLYYSLADNPDPDLQRLFEERMNDKRPGEVAAELGWTEKKVRAVQRRLDRRLTALTKGRDNEPRVAKRQE